MSFPWLLCTPPRADGPERHATAELAYRAGRRPAHPRLAALANPALAPFGPDALARRPT